MSRLRRIFALVALALFLAPLAASAPLFDPDEGLHAAIAQEMVLTGDYVTPRFLGKPFLDKPILFFWAEAFSLRAFGMNETAVRIPPLTLGLLGMISVALLGRALFDESAGLIGGVVYGTMLLPMAVSEVAVHDVGVVPFMCAAIWCLVRVAGLPPDHLRQGYGGPPKPSAKAEGGSHEIARGHVARRHVASAFRRKILFTILAGIFLGLSILTKGLVGIAFTGIFAVCFAFVRRDALVPLAVALTVAVIVAAIVAAPWYVAMERAHPGYLYYYFIERHLQGYLTATQRHAGRPWWYYVPVAIGGALPWTGYLVSALRRRRPGTLAGDPAADRLRMVLWSWFAVGLVFLSVGESKLVTYALPLFPALAILAGVTIASGAGLRSGFGFAVFSVTLVVLPLAGLLFLKLKFGEMSTIPWIITALASLAIAGVAFGRGLRGPRRSAPATLEDPIGALLRLPAMALFALMIVMPRAAAWMTGRDLAAALNRADHLPSRVHVLDERIGSVIFYLKPQLRAEADAGRIDHVSAAEAVQALRAEPLDAVLAVRNNQLRRFNRLFASPPVPDATAGTFTMFRTGSLRTAVQDGTR